MPLCRARSSNSRFSVIHSFFSRALASIQGNWGGGDYVRAAAAQVNGEHPDSIEVTLAHHRVVGGDAAEPVI